jgi:hypothetical protein
VRTNKSNLVIAPRSVAQLRRRDLFGCLKKFWSRQFPLPSDPVELHPPVIDP